MEEGQTQTIKQNRRKLPFIIGGTVLVMVLVSGVYFFTMRNSSPIPASVANQAVFSLYYPSKLPKGYQIDKKSFQYVDRRVSYTLVSKTQPKMLVTVQPKPAAYNLDEFTNNLPGKIGVLTPYGTAAVGISGETKLGSLVDGDVWYLMTTSSKVPDQNVKTILSSLKKQ